MGNILAASNMAVLATAGYMRAITNLKTVLLSLGSAIGAVMQIGRAHV